MEKVEIVEIEKIKRKVKNLDAVIECYLKFYKKFDITTLAFAQGGDFIGGIQSAMWKQKLRRKAMNAFFCSVERPFKFFGTLNEDVNAYSALGRKGELFFSVAYISITQTITQKNAGGMTGIYSDVGTFVKSFYSVMACPSGVKISVMGNKDLRIHHKLSFDHVAPKIISDKWKKEF